MKSKKPNIYILPGWGHRLSDPYYRKLIDFVSTDFVVVPIKFNTRNPKRSLGSSVPFSKVVAALDTQIVKPCNQDTLFGFSIGSLLAYQLSVNNTFEHTILCSIAPCFGEDLLSCPRETTKDFSEVQYQEMSKLNYAPLRSKKVTVLYGEKEAESVKKRSRSIALQNHGKIIEVEGGVHDFDEKYLKAIENLFV